MKFTQLASQLFAQTKHQILLKFLAGEKISPIEVDAVLLAHPDIAQAVAFGVPDDKYGEEVSPFCKILSHNFSLFLQFLKYSCVVIDKLCSNTKGRNSDCRRRDIKLLQEELGYIQGAEEDISDGFVAQDGHWKDPTAAGGRAFPRYVRLGWSFYASLLG